MSDKMIAFPSDKPCFTSPRAMRHEVYLSGPLTGPEDYVDWVRTIRSAGPDDVIELHLNTPGGDVYTAIQLLHAFDSTDAHVHVVIAGICASAGTILMTVGDSFEIHPATSFMFHNYSGGMRGKGNEMHIQMEYERKWSVQFMKDTYHGLLTEDEINSLVDGRDFWLSAEDVGDRLLACLEDREARMKELIESLTEVVEEKPKKKKPAKKKATKKKKD